MTLDATYQYSETHWKAFLMGKLGTWAIYSQRNIMLYLTKLQMTSMDMSICTLELVFKPQVTFIQVLIKIIFNKTQKFIHLKQFLRVRIVNIRMEAVEELPFSFLCSLLSGVEQLITF